MLEKERLKRGWTQNEVSLRVGVARSTYANYEKGKREPDFETSQKLADLFETTIDYLLGKELKEPSIEETEKQKKIRTLHELADGYNTDEELDAAIIVLKSIKK